MYTIEQKLIKVNKYTRPGTRQLDIRAVVIHWTANPGATALNHYNYFNNGAGGRYAGCHYFVDKTSIIQLVPDNEVTYQANENGVSKIGYLNNLWVGSYKGNANVASVGIEMCVEKDGSYAPETLEKTFWLANHLLKKYNLPIDRLVRHHDITGKQCPAKYLTTATWNDFKSKVLTANGGTETSKGGNTVAEVSTRTHIAVARIKVDTLNMRKGPGVDHELVRALKKDESYKVYSINADGWLDLGSGWISNKKNAYVNVELLWD